MNTPAYLMVGDPPGKPPAPAVRVQTAREVFARRFGREPARVFVCPAEVAAGAEARALALEGAPIGGQSIGERLRDYDATVDGARREEEGRS